MLARLVVSVAPLHAAAHRFELVVGKLIALLLRQLKHLFGGLACLDLLLQLGEQLVKVRFTFLSFGSTLGILYVSHMKLSCIFWPPRWAKETRALSF